MRAGLGGFAGACAGALAGALLAEPVFSWAYGEGGTTAGNGNILEDAIVGMMTGLARFLMAALFVGILVLPLLFGLPLLGAGLALRGAPYVGRTVLIGGVLLAGLAWLGGAVLGSGGFWVYPVGAAGVLAGSRAIVESRWPAPDVRDPA